LKNSPFQCDEKNYCIIDKNISMGGVAFSAALLPFHAVMFRIRASRPGKARDGEGGGVGPSAASAVPSFFKGRI
jgi:hypothetical protein